MHTGPTRHQIIQDPPTYKVISSVHKACKDSEAISPTNVIPNGGSWPQN